jgi:glycosyltransferase involved in cell wall biosynthesis
MELPFPYENLGVLSQAATAEAMRQSSVHLSFSMSNISTVAFEAMGCGCATVEADVPPVRAMVEPGHNCVLAEPQPEAVAVALRTLVDDAALRHTVAAAGHESVKHLSVENMGAQFELLLLRSSFRLDTDAAHAEPVASARTAPIVRKP